MLDSKQLRKEILKSRDQLSPAEISEKSRKIEQQLLLMDQIKDKNNIFAYVSFRSEVETLNLIDELLQLKKNVTVPYTRVKERELDAIKIANRDSDLEPGYCDIPEPHKQQRLSNTVAPETIEVVLLPGSVFDLRGGRFGYGGGFYDRFVSNVPDAIRIGLAFDLQIVPEAPLQAHDEILDFVVTETRIITGNRKQ